MKSSSRSGPGNDKSAATGHIAKRAARSKHHQPARTHSSNFRAATIDGGMNCCEAARRIANQKFLAAHVPTLPLGGCSHPERCHCKYRHLPDRRQERRRDSDYGLPNRVYTQVERRSRRDRRHSRLQKTS